MADTKTGTVKTKERSKESKTGTTVLNSDASVSESKTVESKNNKHDKESMMAKKETEKKNTKLGKDVITDLEDLQDLMKETIENGSTTVEKVHQAIAKLPLTYLGRIDQVEDLANDAMEVQKKTIGHIYSLLRTVNDKFADISGDVLVRADGYLD